MSEPILKKRKVLSAVLLSLLMSGLGYIYCGRIVKGITAILFMYALNLAILTKILEINFSIIWLIIYVLVSLLLYIFIIVDSGYIAKYKSENYILKDYNKWYVYVLLFFFVGVGNANSGLYFRDNYVEKFSIPAGSNYPTIIPGDRILANKVIYKTNDPERGDVVVFTNPENRRENYMKRVVAVAGDTVEMKDNQLYVNGKQLQRQELAQSTLDSIRITYPNGKKVEGDVFYEFNGGAKYKVFLSNFSSSRIIRDFAPLAVPKNHCFVLGDNRNDSYDSRHFGSIPLAIIKGRAEWLYWPSKNWSRFGRLDVE